MATYWQVPPMFRGQTVVVMGAGPSLTQERADSYKKFPRVCARYAYRRAPDADMVIAMDEYPNDGFWDEVTQNYKGILVTGVNDPRLNAKFVPIPAEMYWYDRKLKFMFNNGTAAIRLAAMTKPSKIVLLGFDPLKPGSFYDNDPQGANGQLLYEGLDQILTNLINELNIEVVWNE